MDLRSKLGLLRPPVAPPASSHEGHQPINAGFLPAAMTPHGPVRFSQRHHGAGFRQGTVELAGARVVAGATLARIALDRSLEQVDASRMLFVDTETTGLNGGVGTLPFLIGLAWFEDEALVVRQLFLGRPGEERPLLELLSESISKASLLVTFNGKCFDWPLLRTRLLMNRVRAPVVPPHLDLLHCSRRIFKRRLKATRLQDLEAHVLGFHREHDIDGAQIPAVYFDWLRRGTTAQLERVLEHNVRDVVTMAALLAALARRVERIEEADAPEDCLSLAHLALRAGDEARAETLAVWAAERSTHGSTALEGWALAAQLAGRRRDWSTVAQRLEQALASPGAEHDQVQAVHLALARVLEHRLKNRPQALIHAHLGAGAEPAAAHAKRMGRLREAAR